MGAGVWRRLSVVFCLFFLFGETEEMLVGKRRVRLQPWPHSPPSLDAWNLTPSFPVSFPRPGGECAGARWKDRFPSPALCPQPYQDNSIEVKKLECQILAMSLSGSRGILGK